jgi:hypothetical protein
MRVFKKNLNLSGSMFWHTRSSCGADEAVTAALHFDP